VPIFLTVTIRKYVSPVSYAKIFCLFYKIFVSKMKYVAKREIDLNCAEQV